MVGRFLKVNCWSRCEFIRLRIQYGTEISKEVEYQSIYKSKRHFSLMWGMSFFMFVTENLQCKTTNSVLQQICSQCFLLLFLLSAISVAGNAYRNMPQSLWYFFDLRRCFNQVIRFIQFEIKLFQYP